MPERKTKLPATNKKRTSAKRDTVQVELLNPAEGLPTLYVNNAHATSSVMELRLDLGEIEGRDSRKNKLTVNNRVRLYMSWEFARRLSGLLQGQIEQMSELESRDAG